MKVSDLLDFYPTNSLSWEQLDYDVEDIQNLHYGLIHVGLPTLIDLSTNQLPGIKPDNMPKHYELCKEGDVAFADASEDTNEVAKVVELYNLGNKQAVCGLHTIHGRDNHNRTIKGFKGYALSSCSFHLQIRRLAQGTKIYSISTKNFAESYISIPSKEEQERIVSLLYLIDQRIATQNKIIEDLKTLKSAIIEMSYNCAGEMCKIGDLIVQVSKRNKENSYPVLSVNNQLGFIEQADQFEDRTVASEDTSNYKVVSTDDFAYNPARINVGSIARLKDREKGIVSPMYVCFHTKTKLLPEYMEYFFDTSYFRHEMYKRLEGSVRLCLSYEGLCNISMLLPTIEEQKKLSNRIFVIEHKIQLESKILKSYRQQKTYLLQQMFI